MIQKGIWSVFLMGFIFLSACTYDKGEDMVPVDCETDSLTYNGQIGVLINANCATSGCHNQGGQPPALTNYSNVKANLNRIEVRALIEKTMPPSGPLSSCNQSQLSTWIANGSPE
jgi:hypothetical protein